MRLARKVELQPTKQQERELFAHLGVAKWTWNWARKGRRAAQRQWREDIRSGIPKKKCTKMPGSAIQSKEITKIKKLPEDKGGKPWLAGVSARVSEQRLRDLDKSVSRWFEYKKEYKAWKEAKDKGKKVGKPPLKVGFPKYKESAKGYRVYGAIIFEKAIKLPVIGRIRIKPGQQGYIEPGNLRYINDSGPKKGKESQLPLSVTYRAGRWYASVTGTEIDLPPYDGSRPIVGIDRNVNQSHWLALSDGTTYSSPKAAKKYKKKMKKLSKAICRKKGGSTKEKKSNNCKKAIKAKNRLEKRQADLRQDAIHKATTEIAKKYSIIVLEDLQLKNMGKSAKGTKEKPGKNVRAKAGLNRELMDACLYEIERQLTYKAALYGGVVVKVPPHYTSQTCSVCGYVDKANRKSQAAFECVVCGHKENADLNAAKNIKNLFVAGSCPETQNACGEYVSPAKHREVNGGIDSVKQESAAPSGAVSSSVGKPTPLHAGVGGCAQRPVHAGVE